MYHYNIANVNYVNSKAKKIDEKKLTSMCLSGPIDVEMDKKWDREAVYFTSNSDIQFVAEREGENSSLIHPPVWNKYTVVSWVLWCCLQVSVSEDWLSFVLQRKIHGCEHEVPGQHI